MDISIFMANVYKKSEAGFIFIFIFVIIILFLGLFANLDHGFGAGTGCRGNRDCGADAYCGSDFLCHQFPTIQKTVVQYNFIIPSIIIGIAIVIAAIIFRWKSKNHKEAKHAMADSTDKANIKAPEEVEEISEPYYKSQGKVRTP